MFGSESGAARRLGSKIDLALAVGLITARTHSQCTVLRKLRNQLAHSIDPDEIDTASALSLISRFSYTRPDQSELTEGVKIEPLDVSTFVFRFLGEEFDVDDLVTILSRDRELLWLYPDAAAYPSRDDDIRQQIWSYITAAIVPVLGSWLSDESLLEVMPRTHGAERVSGAPPSCPLERVSAVRPAEPQVPSAAASLHPLLSDRQ